MEHSSKKIKKYIYTAVQKFGISRFLMLFMLIKAVSILSKKHKHNFEKYIAN